MNARADGNAARKIGAAAGKAHADQRFGIGKHIAPQSRRKIGQHTFFFHVKQQSLRAQEGNGRETLTQEQVDVVARELDVKREEVMEMEARMAGGDVMLDPAPRDDGEEAFGPIAYLADADHEPTAMLESRQRDVMVSDGLSSALEALDERSRRIVEERWLKVNDDGSGGMTLHELAAEYGVSAERVRQIEAAAMKKMRKALAEAVTA